MIIGSWNKKEIGKTYYGLNDKDGKTHHEIPYVVLREATYEEWAKDKPNGWDRPEAKESNFYLISID